MSTTVESAYASLQFLSFWSVPFLVRALTSRNTVVASNRRIGTAFPVFAQRHKRVGVPEWAFFTVKYFGSGVIIATAFIHVGSLSCSV